jgi:hypothetical protein
VVTTEDGTRLPAELDGFTRTMRRREDKGKLVDPGLFAGQYECLHPPAIDNERASSNY